MHEALLLLMCTSSSGVQARQSQTPVPMMVTIERVKHLRLERPAMNIVEAVNIGSTESPCITLRAGPMAVVDMHNAT